MRTIYLKWHLGLGDAIVCNGLVRDLALRYKRVILPAKPDKVSSVIAMFSDLPGVFVDVVKNDAEMLDKAQRHDSIGLGLWSKRGLLYPRLPWDQQFYEDARVDFELRWSGFKIPKLPETETPSYPFALFHEDVGRKMLVTRGVVGQIVVDMPKMPHIFWNLGLMRTASELHFINSCFVCLAETVDTPGRLVLHKYARSDGGLPTLRKKWEIIE